jgi:hypothetical protein
VNTRRSTSELNEAASVVVDYVKFGTLPLGSSVIHERSKGRGLLFRILVNQASTLIVKVWMQRGLRYRIRRILGISNAQHEWRIHRYLHASGAPVPIPFAYGAKRVGRRAFEMVVVEDLGSLTTGLMHLKRCLRDGQEETAKKFEREIIRITVGLVRAGVLDIDHKLNNFGVTDDGSVYRLDIECARRWRGLPVEVYGKMLGRLIASHAFACQPALERTEAFATNLAYSLDAPRHVLARARAEVELMFRQQEVKVGIDSRLQLPW